MNGIINIGRNGFTSTEAIKQAVKALSNGQLIAVPTDTIYGIAALAQNNQAVDALYRIKRRDQKKPIAICVSDIRDIPKWGKITIPLSLLEDLLPGPVTVVLERTSELNPNLNPDTSLVGIRIPNHSFLQAVTKVCNQCLALTSANISSQSNTLSVEEFRELWPHLEYVFDVGRLDDNSKRLGSTVIDLSVPGYYKVIRKGCAYDETIKKLHHFNLKKQNEDL
ncbi:yrdC domain-containing protein, mitochondrial-like isoform X2 [Centruroides sculpturatus]|uniref:yrdC domain-containing protein, mitochondrial-like isoform X1 n=1 Tax=Centruroides sculpturatus TaxID=218467 RepID=UPI000C6D88BE|nr:yrdC domain-containing protein, mitochondrial-like isoform X1 [Centruroides sculpturatus]XP_023223504.1 yrdC domain-containing protein, mitochondrial-like isoform X1 [Centruroides sculpturatus]XP_023223505.1 yrdC domain-containing protein, mitochondrial-like isoform X2 [Centruroides sculpturatus]